MTLILEYGSGAIDSNAYVDAAFVTSYLTERGRETENSWDTALPAAQEAAIIAATDYIDTRWGGRFSGTRNVFWSGSPAQALLTLTGIPIADETLIVGNQTYVFKDALTQLANDEILIGVDADETTTNIIAAVEAEDTAGVNYSEALLVNIAANAQLQEGQTAVIIFTSRQEGSNANSIPLSTAATNITVTAGFQNGTDQGPQALEFPRALLFGHRGLRITGVPLKVRHATAEYAIRAHAATLFKDPTIDDTGRAVTGKREKVGPIETETKYEDGATLSNLIRPYPAADRLLSEFIKPAGMAIR